MYSHNYLSNADWDVLQNPRIDFNTKARTVIARLSSVGVKNPTEGTMVSLTALVYMAAHPGPPETLEAKPTHAYSTLCDLKCLLRGWKQKATTTFVEFPPDPLDFKKSRTIHLCNSLC